MPGGDIPIAKLGKDYLVLFKPVNIEGLISLVMLVTPESLVFLATDQRGIHIEGCQGLRRTTLDKGDPILIDLPQGFNIFVGFGDEGAVGLTFFLLVRIMKGRQVTKHRRGRNKGPAAFLAPTPLKGAPFTPGQPIMFHLAHDPTESFVSLQFLKIGDTVTTSQVQQNQSDNDLMVAPALIAVAANIEMTTDGVTQPRRLR